MTAPFSRRLLRVLFVEDNPDDVELVLRILDRAGFEVVHERVETDPDLRRAILQSEWDLVISDYTMPAFSGPRALEVLKQSRRDIPFVMLSGTVGEETAVASMRAGAEDFLLKTNLQRLVPAIERELRDARERRARRRAEEHLRRRDAILTAVGSVAQELLRSSGPESGIEAVVSRVGQATGVDRAFVYEFQRAGIRWSAYLRHEWMGPGGMPRLQDPSLQGLVLDDESFGVLTDPLEAGHPVHGVPSEFPEPVAALMRRYDVRSFVLAPILVDASLWGVLGLAHLGTVREWLPSEVQSLATVGDTIGAAIQRRVATRRIERQVQHLAALREIDLAIISRPGLESSLDTLLSGAIRQLEVDAAAVLLLNPDREVLECVASRGFTTNVVQRTAIAIGEDPTGMTMNPAQGPWAGELDASDPRRPEFAVEEGFSAYAGCPVILEGRVIGVIETFQRRPAAHDAEWLSFLELLAGQAAIAIDHARLIENLRRANKDLEGAYDATLSAWSALLDLRDRETEGHSQRVAEMTMDLARALDVPPDQLVHLRRGALLHDIGKMGIPDAILHKAGPLTDEEWKIMRLHPVYAYDFLKEIPFLRPAGDIPHLHHERWNGSGYPLGLREEEIPLSARIFAVADVWDAMRSARPYRRGLSREEVLTHLDERAGVEFDPAVVTALKRVLDS